MSKYYEGKKCQECGNTKRYKSNFGCVECVRTRQRAKYKPVDGEVRPPAEKYEGKECKNHPGFHTRYESTRQCVKCVQERGRALYQNYYKSKELENTAIYYLTEDDQPHIPKYVGRTKNLANRMKGHIAVRGRDTGLKMEIIDYVDDELAYEAERWLINEFSSAGIHLENDRLVEV